MANLSHRGFFGRAIAAAKTDGGLVVGGLIAVGNILYGTTDGGGKFGHGIIFKMTLAGQETILHSFTGADGSEPQASLLNVNGTLYGTTTAGGANGNGTIFSITTDGTYSLVYSFPQDGGTGKIPVAALINVNGTLYGTTEAGGLGNGTVFSLTP